MTQKCGAVLLVAMLASCAAQADILAYEGFDYSPGTNLGGSNGGTGWNGGWAGVAGDGEIHSNSLAIAFNGPRGFDARSTGNAVIINNGNRAGRLLDCSNNGAWASHGYLNGNNQIGVDGKTLYISFLQQSSGTVKFFEFEFHRGNLGDAGRVAGIGNDFNSTTVNLRAPNSMQTPLGAGDLNVNLYIVRIDFKPGNDHVYVYRNPAADAEDRNEPVLTMLEVADMSFDGISLAAFVNGISVKNDEIRLGETWGDVLGGPPLFAVQPENQALYLGQHATFTASAKSREPIGYQWFHDGALLASQTNTSLILTGTQYSDVGDYWVVASNALGVATSAVAAATVRLMNLEMAPRSLTVGEGTNLTITTTVEASQPVSMQWFKDGLPLSGATNSSLQISPADVFDAGKYVLVAGNAFGMATSTVASVYPDLGGILAYEGFDYSPDGDIAGANGGIGWSGTWLSIHGNTSRMLASNLTAGTNGPAGFDAHSAGTALFQPNGSRKGRLLDCTASGNFGARGLVNDNGNLGASGSTLYLSFLQQPNGSSKFYEFEFHRGDLGDPGRIAGVGNDLGSATVNFRAPNGIQYSLGTGTTNVSFYVVRIDFKGGNDDVRVYRNPTGSTESANTPALVLPGAGDMSFNAISFGAYDNGRTVAHDEIRIGVTWDDAVGNASSRLRLAGWTNGESFLQVAGTASHSYQIHGASQLSGPWTNVGTVVIPNQGLGGFTETNAFALERYYRAQAEPALASPDSTSVLIADFESGSYGDWTTTGNAFGTSPAHGTLPGQGTVSGYYGTWLVDSYNGGDANTGTLTSKPFIITRPTISFLIGGGHHPGQTCINLVVGGLVVRSATGADNEMLGSAFWDVSDYIGQSATIQIVDSAVDTWGHINIDHIVMTDTIYPALSRQLLLTNSLLNFPVKNSAPSRRISVVVSGNTVRDFNIPLADAVPDWWAFVDVSNFQGQVATVTVDSLSPGSTGLSSMVQTNGIVGATNLYRETLRPQLHFSSRRGWLNDPNGMIYYGGNFHLYYQHNPFNWDGTDQKYWGHAISTDMVHWTELPEALYPHAHGDWVWSGSAVVDRNNTAGFKTGTNDVIVAAFTSTGRGECIAFSNDGGLTFTDYTNNPVVTHSGRDPHLFWYEPSRYWVMAVYDSTGGDGISFYSSQNLRQWTYRSKIGGFFECPDMFEMPVDGNTNNMKWVLYAANSDYMIGQFDGAVFTPDTPKIAGNDGAGFYAAQTFTEMPHGDSRRVRIGWAIVPMPGMPFNQMMFFPTVLTLRTLPAGVRLCSEPVAEISTSVANSYSWTNLTLNPGTNPLSGIRGDLFDVQAEFNPGSAQSLSFILCGVPVTYSPSARQITCRGISKSLPAIDGSVKLRILTDRQTVEIFGNAGDLYMPIGSTPYSPTNDLLVLNCQGASVAFKTLVINKLKSTWSVSSP